MASIILIGLCVVLILYAFFKKQYNNDNNKPAINLPPGPPNLPYFGSYLYLLLINYKWTNRAAHYLGKLYKSDVIGFKVGDFPAVVANSYEGVKQIFSGSDFDGRPDVFLGRLRDPHFNRKGIFFNDGPVWKEQRRFILRYLRDYGFGRRYQELEAVINEELFDLTDLIKNGPKFAHEEEFFQKGKLFCPNAFTYMTTNCFLHILCNERLPREERGINNKAVRSGMKFLRLGDDYGLFLSQRPWIRYLFPKWSKFEPLRESTLDLLSFFQVYIDKYLKTFNENDEDRNFIDMYIREFRKAEKEGQTDTTFGMDQLALSLVDFAFPAMVGIGSQMSFLLQRLLLNPEALRKIQAEVDEVVGNGRLPCLDDRQHMSYTEAAVREGLRIDTLVPSSIPHRSVVDTQLLGYTVPKDTVVIAGLEVFHLDEKIWGDPLSFRPERFLDENRKLSLKKDITLPFGGGKRLCAGETFARNMLFLLTSTICQQFDVVLNENERPPDMSETLCGIITSPPDFWINLKERK